MTFWGAPQIGSPGLTRSIEVNIVEYLKWLYLQAGAYTNVAYNAAAVPAAGVPMGTLKYFDDKERTGRVWQARRTNWLWESGVNQPTQPAAVAVYLGGALQSSGYKIDYNGGQIVFDAAQPLNSLVQCSYGYRGVQVYDTATDWVRELDVNSQRMDDPRNPTAAAVGGDLEIFPSRRAQPPLITVNPAFNYRAVPYEIGSSTMKVTQDYKLVAMAQTPWELQFLHDTLVSCDGKALPTFDLGAADHTFNSDGSLAPSPKTFPTLCSTYPYKYAYVKTARSTSPWSGGALHTVEVKWAVETIV